MTDRARHILEIFAEAQGLCPDAHRAVNDGWAHVWYDRVKRRWAAANKARQAEYQARHVAKKPRDPEKMRAYKAAHYARNAEKLRAKRRERWHGTKAAAASSVTGDVTP